MMARWRRWRIRRLQAALAGEVAYYGDLGDARIYGAARAIQRRIARHEALLVARLPVARVNR